MSWRHSRFTVIWKHPLLTKTKDVKGTAVQSNCSNNMFLITVEGSGRGLVDVSLVESCVLLCQLSIDLKLPVPFLS